MASFTALLQWQVIDIHLYCSHVNERKVRLQRQNGWERNMGEKREGGKGTTRIKERRKHNFV